MIYCIFLAFFRSQISSVTFLLTLKGLFVHKSKIHIFPLCCKAIYQSGLNYTHQTYHWAEGGSAQEDAINVLCYHEPLIHK